MTEQWRAVPGWEGLYEVSDLGRVRSLDRLTRPGGRGRGQRRRGRVLVLRPTAKGYRSVSLCSEAGQRTRLVHHLVLDAFVGTKMPGQECRHLNGDRADNRLVNLAWGTSAENHNDTVRHGRTTQGERNPMAKLSEADVRAIRAARARGESQRSVATRFGITPTLVSQIDRRVVWRHVW